MSTSIKITANVAETANNNNNDNNDSNNTDNHEQAITPNNNNWNNHTNSIIDVDTGIETGTDKDKDTAEEKDDDTIKNISSFGRSNNHNSKEEEQEQPLTHINETITSSLSSSTLSPQSIKTVTAAATTPAVNATVRSRCCNSTKRTTKKTTIIAAMSRKDDPVFNVKFVQLVECKPCLWNSTHPGYSKKEEIQNAWASIANETKDTVRNCRERWRTIRSSFLRSLKLSRTQTGRNKRKYYLSKYLQFLIPYTKTRLKSNGSGSASGSNVNTPATSSSSSLMVLRKVSAAAAAAAAAASSSSSTSASVSVSAEPPLIAVSGATTSLPTTPLVPPMTCITNMPLTFSKCIAATDIDEPKDSRHTQVPPVSDDDMLGTLQDNTAAAIGAADAATAVTSTPSSVVALCMQRKENSIKLEHCISSSSSGSGMLSAPPHHISMLEHQHHHQQIVNGYLSESHTQTSQAAVITATANTNVSKSAGAAATSQQHQHLSQTSMTPNAPPTPTLHAMEWSELAELLKTKNDYHRLYLLNSTTNSPTPPAAAAASGTIDADQSFLNSLHPYLREMSGKQNRRFRQKVVALIDAILDNVDI